MKKDKESRGEAEVASPFSVFLEDFALNFRIAEPFRLLWGIQSETGF